MILKRVKSQQGLGKLHKVRDWGHSFKMNETSNFEKAKSHFLNGMAALHQANLNLAEEEFCSSLELLPDRVSTLTNLSAVQLKLNKFEEALKHALQAIKLEESNWEAWLNSGIASLKLNKPLDAISKLDKALKINPQAADAWSGKAMALDNLGNSQEALQCFDQALTLKPDVPDYWSNKAGTLNNLGEYQSAAQCIEHALKLKSSYPEAWHNLGISLFRQKNYLAAQNAFNNAIMLDPMSHDSLFNKGLVELTLGNFDSGWDLYEYRWQSKWAETYRYPSIPQLPGLEEAKGKRVLVWHEQGFGDTIQFSRYIPILIEHGSAITFEVQEALRPLFDGVFSCKIVSQHQSDQQFDYQIPLMSLPRLSHTRLETIPGCITLPNQSPEDAPSGERLKKSLKIGLAISGNRSHRNDHNRSLSLNHFESLAKKAHIYLIQKEVGALDTGTLEKCPQIQFMGNKLHDFQDTAALVKQMDLIITVDTSMVHLAGTLNKKTFLILPWDGEWRWLIDQSDSPWYPSVRIFRQTEPGNWDQVIKTLEQLIGG